MFVVPALSADSSVLDKLLNEAHARHLADQRYWRIILHYHTDILGLTRSDIDDPRFFFCGRGGSDPQCELDATLKAFFAVPASSTKQKNGAENPEDQPAQCRFPARYAWLKEELPSGNEIPAAACTRYEQWRAHLDPSGITLIFASYYMSNPSSMYGHTLLRLDQIKHSNNERLLDYTVNFAAVPTRHNPFLYGFYGLAGGFHGRFSTMPYYMKVQEYNNMESRDLWEYSLALTPKQIENLMRHLWEMGNASMPYYFLIRNCSYQLLTLLEAADPELHLTDQFRFKAIPVDTLRAVLRYPGLVSKIERRPSHVHRMLAARSLLNKDEIRLARKISADAGPQNLALLRGRPPERQALILESAYDYFCYRAGFRPDQPEKVQEQEQLLLLARNQLGAVSHVPVFLAYQDRPDQGHATGRMGVSYGFTNHSHFEELSLRPALHDLNEDVTGYVPGSQLQMFNLRLRYDNDRRTTYLQEFTIVDLLSLSPYDQWVHPPSWKVKTGLAVANDLSKDPENSLYYGLNVGTGYTVRCADSAMAYALAETDMGVGHVFDHSGRVGGGGSTGLLFDLGAHWESHLEAGYYYYFLGDDHPSVKLKCIQAFPITRNWQLRATLQRQNQYKELLFSLFRYL
jgi:hypothetical protein